LQVVVPMMLTGQVEHSPNLFQEAHGK